MRLSGFHISLFSGIGMMDLALERAGYKTVLQAESDPYCQEVLRMRFPTATLVGDVAQVRGNSSHKYPLVMSGGFPCQGFSAIGRGKGFQDERSQLWVEFRRCIDEFRPDVVFIENSPRLRTRGMRIVLDDLAILGYDARWDGFTAAGQGAPHLRDRLFIVARRAREVGFRRMAHPVAVIPRAGKMVDGFCTSETPREPIRTARTVPTLPLFPTPRAAANEWRTTRNAPSHGKTHGKTLAGELNDIWALSDKPKPSDGAGNVNPDWVEWLMGVPMGWTDLSFPGDQSTFPNRNNGWRTLPGVPGLKADVPNRRARLQALGNTCVWQTAHNAFLRLV